jgi:hypothetical protein
MLSVMSLAYQDFTPEQLTMGGKIEDYRQRLFATYIDRMFQRRGTTQQYSRADSQRWLIWLAQRMTVASQTVFLIDRLQPSWLLTKGQRIRYRLESGFIAGITSGLIYKLIYGIIYDGFIAGMIVCLWVGLTGKIKTFETFQWSWREAINGFRDGMILGVIAGLFTGVFDDEFIADLSDVTDWLINSFLLLSITGIIGGLFGMIIIGFRGYKIQKPEKPNHGIIKSGWNAVIIGMLICIVTLLISILFIVFTDKFIINELSDLIELIESIIEYIAYKPMIPLKLVLIPVLIASLLGGGNAFMQHFILRCSIYRKRYAPWNYASFLDYASERLFLQKVGGGYIFVHRMLLEHFAEMSLEQGKH